MNYRFDFARYVELRKDPGSQGKAFAGFGAYAYSGDIRVLRTIRHAAPVRLAAEATVRAFKALGRSDLLGQSVKVSARQYPRIHEIVRHCANVLEIPVPTVYIRQNFASINAGTFGTETDSFILINSATVDRLSEDELKFVIGHECGHIQNQHVTYGTALHFLTSFGAIFVRWLVGPARLALNGWSRRAEITCDRAGMICCNDLDVAVKTMVKLAVGSQSLTDDIDIEAYLQQDEELRQGIGRLSELGQSHPYLPKRVRALRIFADSDYFRRRVGLAGGKSLAEVDKEVDEVIRVI